MGGDDVGEGDCGAQMGLGREDSVFDECDKMGGYEWPGERGEFIAIDCTTEVGLRSQGFFAMACLTLVGLSSGTSLDIDRRTLVELRSRGVVARHRETMVRCRSRDVAEEGGALLGWSSRLIVLAAEHTLLRNGRECCVFGGSGWHAMFHEPRS